VSLAASLDAPAVAPRGLGASSSERVGLSVALPAHAGNDTRRGAAELLVTVVLVESTTGDAAHPDRGDTGVLPATGFAPDPAMLWLAAVLIGVGACVVARSKRRATGRQTRTRGGG